MTTCADLFLLYFPVIAAQYGRRGKMPGVGKPPDPARLGADLDDVTSEPPPLLDSSIDEVESSQTEGSLAGGELEEAGEELKVVGPELPSKCAEAES